MQLKWKCIKYATIQVLSDMYFPSKRDSVLMDENIAQRKTVFWHISTTNSLPTHLFAIRGKQNDEIVFKIALGTRLISRNMATDLPYMLRSLFSF